MAKSLVVALLVSLLTFDGAAGQSPSPPRPIVVGRLGVGLVTVDPVTGKILTRLTRARHAFRTRGREPLWSPNGKKIAYAKGHEENLEIWVMRADGTRKRRITQNDVLDQWPSWAPGSKRLAIERWVSSERRRIFIVRADGSHERSVTRRGFDDTCPDWSPDGKRIVFPRKPGEDIYTMKPDGSGLKQLTSGVDLDGGPIWSPDGRQILFRRRTDATSPIGTTIQFDLFVVDRNGSNLTQLTDTPAHEYSYGWSPDGKSISFMENEDASSSSMWVMNADGSGAGRVTDFDGVHFPSPTWSRSGKRLIYLRVTGEGGGARTDLWSVRPNGSDDHRLAATNADEIDPDWHAAPQECTDAY